MKAPLFLMFDNTKENKQAYFLCLYFLSYVCFGIVMSNVTPFLSNLGYDAMQRGILLSAYAITTILFQMLFGILVDRYQTVKKIIIASIMVFAICSMVLFYQTGMLFALHLILIAFSCGLLNTLCGLYDTWVLASSQELANRLSFIKAFGSIGWAIGSVFASYLILYLSYQGMAISIFFIMGLALGTIFLIPDMKKVTRKKKTDWHDVKSLLMDHQYICLVVILFLLYSMVIANNCTVIDKMLALGASQTEISLKWSIQSLLEIPTYILGVKLLHRCSHIRLLQFSASMLILQFLLFASTQSVSLIILFSCFQLFSTPLLMITSKALIQQISKPQLQGSSQLIALSIFTGVSSFMIPSIMGYFCVMLGIDLALYSVTGFGIVAFLLLYRYQKQYSSNKAI